MAQFPLELVEASKSMGKLTGSDGVTVGLSNEPMGTTINVPASRLAVIPPTPKGVGFLPERIVNRKMTRAQRWRVSKRLIYGIVFLCLLFLSGVAQRTYAQSATDTTSPEEGTVPPGTVPISTTLYLPLVSTQPLLINPVVFQAIPVQGPPVDRPAATNGDLNLALRSYISTTSALTLVNINGPIDPDAPQLDGLFNPPRLPTFTAVYRVKDWNWSCSADGCPGAPLTEPPVTLLEMAVTPGEPIRIPTRNAPIFSGDYKALVLYAEAQRITIAYTREDTPAIGYVVHLEDVVIDPALLTLYTQLNATGRSQLPALHNAENLGVAAGNTIKVAIRDTGSFMDPRSRKDWWNMH